MPIPQHPPKHDSPAHFEPIDHFDYFRDSGIAPSGDPPRGAIITYQRSLLRHVLATEQPERVLCVVGNVYPLPSTGGSVVVGAEFGIGAPAAAMLFELLIAWGVRRFISIGTAGGLQSDARVGQLAVCSAAVRDEGVSHHYLADHNPFVTPSAELTARFAHALQTSGDPPLHGPTWTTDAPFRETRAEIAHYQAQGVLTVEMEAAALFAIAAVRDVEIAAGFVISDVLAEERWNPQFRASETFEGLVRLYEAARAILQE